MTIKQPLYRFNLGVTLIETIVFIVVVSIALGALLRVFSQSVSSASDPAVRARALALAQAQLDEVLARKYDENTPTGGVPACDSPSGVACLGIVPDGDFDDVGDFNGFVANPDSNHSVSVSVVEAGADLGLPNSQARLITVTVTSRTLGPMYLSVYRANF